MLTVINVFVSKLFRKQAIQPLGRWKIDYCKIKTNAKIDWANEDHCGTCGEYALKKILLDNASKKLIAKT